MLIIGITGGIGSGKTTVCNLFKTLGIPVYQADDAAKRIMASDKEVIKKITDLFGKEAYNDEGLLNKAFIAQAIFNHPAQIKKLNAIVHPATMQDSLNWAKKQHAPYVLKESALLFETSAFHHVDKAIGVFAPKNLRIRRVMSRSHISREEVLQRMENQMDEAIKMKLCDFVIINDEQQSLIPQVTEIHRQLIQAAEQSI